MEEKTKGIMKVVGAAVLASAGTVGLMSLNDATVPQPAGVMPQTWSGCCWDPATGTTRDPLPLLGEGEGKCVETRLIKWTWRSPCPTTGTVVLPTPTIPYEETPTPVPTQTPPTPGPTPTRVPNTQPAPGGLVLSADFELVLYCPPEQCSGDMTNDAWKLRGPWEIKIQPRTDRP